ncbi:peptidoglycan DD-metalloendopeptidase family protein [Noviherbaspirillum galbum]|uniref:Peptidoglycan DD-metalloendopeptidase family protein n=1 Tax=Noviherbaspirillum galbum TaxID=2709383 RepID=A0A6B3SP15_9BURK|nr:peptidoglycan DD-metalloendopeptidase family protein [Noviherbaspirillum galbum]NEX62610.1 peptidoglycan DD-metalloendopeptidase family protein [Noviherbaspirillum galbum]
MKKARLLTFLLASGMLAACTTTPRQTAPVVDRTPPPKPVEAPRPPVQAQPVTPPPQKHNERGFYTVKKGDTLIQIALDVGQNYRDLVAWNNLANPNDIKVDQVLRVLPPEGGVQTGAVAPSSGIETKPLPAGTATPPAAAGSAGHKTGPRGEKRPYSDAALAELNKPDAAVAAPSAGTKTEPPKTADKPEKSPEPPVAASPEDEGLSWVWPADGKIVSNFGEGKRGIDIAGKLGQPVLAAGAGKVLYAGSGIRGYGNLVIVKHSNNLLSAYAHNKAIFVKEDQTVTKGQKIAEMGNSDADSVKLHFEIRQQGKPVDPSKFLPSR